MSTYYYQLQLRQYTEANRTTCTPLAGEPFYTTDNKEFFLGDGTTAGGNFISSGTMSQAGADQSPTAAGTLAIAPTLFCSRYAQRILPGAGSGAFTYNVSIARAKMLPGAIVEFYIELPASSNPTVSIKDAVSNTVIGTITNPLPSAPFYYSMTATLCADGAWHKTNGNPIS